MVRHASRRTGMRNNAASAFLPHCFWEHTGEQGCAAHPPRSLTAAKAAALPPHFTERQLRRNRSTQFPALNTGFAQSKHRADWSTTGQPAKVQALAADPRRRPSFEGV